MVPDLLVELLEVATHQILLLRGVYPERAFAKRKKYGLPTSMCEHPAVADFVSGHLLSLRGLLEGKKRAPVERVDVLVVRGEEEVETYVFELGEEGDMNLRPAQLPEVEAKFRSLLLRLNEALPGLGDLGGAGDLSVSFRVHTRLSGAAAAARLGDGDTWAAASETLTSGPNFGRNATLGRIVPVFGMVTPISLNCYVIK